LKDIYINKEGEKKTKHKHFITCQQNSAMKTESLRGVSSYLNKVMNNYSLLEKLFIFMRQGLSPLADLQLSSARYAKVLA